MLLYNILTILTRFVTFNNSCFGTYLLVCGFPAYPRKCGDFLNKIYSTCIKEMKLPILCLLFIQFISVFVNSIIPLINGKFVDLLASRITKNQLIYFALLVGILGLVSIIMAYFYSVINLKTKNKMSLLIFRTQLEKIYRLPFLKIEHYSASYLTQRMSTDASMLSIFFFDSLIPITTNIIKLIILLIILLILNKSVLLITSTFIPIYILMYLLISKPLFNKGQDY